MGDKDGFHRAFKLGLPGKNHAYRPGLQFLDLGEQGRAIHARHAHVADHDIKRTLGKIGQRFFGADGEDHLPFTALAAQDITQTGEHIGVVVHEQNTFQGVRRLFHLHYSLRTDDPSQRDHLLRRLLPFSAMPDESADPAPA